MGALVLRPRNGGEEVGRRRKIKEGRQGGRGEREGGREEVREGGSRGEILDIGI